MNTLLLGAVVVGAVALGTPAASADPGHYYQGGCGFVTAPDNTPNQVLGGNSSWSGVIYLWARSTDGANNITTDLISVRCDVYKNGVLVIYDALSESNSGVVSDSDTLQYVADPDDVITVCEEVAVGSYPVTYHGC